MDGDKAYDIVLYGANGFTAKWTIIHLLKEDISFAIAGRNQTKLQETVEWIKNETNSNKIESVPVIIASIEDLDPVTKPAKIVLNCVGPYIFTGESVVESCIKNKAHYLDITGEPYFIEKCFVKYSELALENQVFIINACGFDSVPADIGVEFFKEELGSEFTPLWCESILTTRHHAFANHTTFESAVYGALNMSDLSKLRKSQGREPSQPPPYKLKVKKLPFYSDITQSWVGLFMGSDASVVKRSQKILNEKKFEKPVQYGAYVELGSFIRVLKFILFGIFFLFMIQFEATRKFLIKHVECLTFGIVKARGPTKEEMSKSGFETIFYGAGKKGDEVKKIQTRVKGPDAGYISTPICFVSCAITLLREINKPLFNRSLKFRGGVLTTAAAFHGTNLCQNLMQRGLNFEKGE